MPALIPPLFAILLAVAFSSLYRSGRVAEIWVSLCGLAVTCGLITGPNGTVGALLAIALFVPPFTMHLRLCQKMLQLTRVNHPDAWKIVGRNAFEMGIYCADERDIGDAEIALLKRESRWWRYAAVVAIFLIPLTLLLISAV